MPRIATSRSAAAIRLATALRPVLATAPRDRVQLRSSAKSAAEPKTR